MKKLILMGVVLLLAIVFVTCDSNLTPEGVIGGNEFATEEYDSSGNLKAVTINLNGGGPSLNTSRALTNALARINHDYYEVVFFYDADGPSASVGPVKVARTSWSRGEGAALAVFRGNDGGTGIDYGSVDFSNSLISGNIGTDEDIGAAILFVGKRTTKGAILLAVGTLKDTANNVGTYTGSTIVKSTTSKVTFEIASLASGIDPTSLATSSFFTQYIDDVAVIDYTTAAAKFTDATLSGGPGSDTLGELFIASIDAASTNNPGQGAQFASQSFKSVYFPLFMLKSDEVSATAPIRFYAGKFSFNTSTAAGLVTAAPSPGDIDHRISAYVKGIVAAAPVLTPPHVYTDYNPPNVLINGEKINGNTEVVGIKATMVNNQTAGSTLNNEAYFVIEVPKAIVGGLITFNFNIPVYAITSSNSDEGITPILWFIQPGVENNYVDNGKGLGGSILLGIGDPSKITIESAFK